MYRRHQHFSIDLYAFSPGKQVIHDVVKDEFVLELNRFNTNMQMNLSANGGDGTAVKVESGQQQQNSPINSKSQSSASTSNEQVRTHYVASSDRCQVIIISASIDTARQSQGEGDDDDASNLLCSKLACLKTYI